MMRYKLGLCMLLGMSLFSACTISEQKMVFYDESDILKELYTAYEEQGKEVRHGLYIQFSEQGDKVREIYYEDGLELYLTPFDPSGRALPTVDLAMNSHLIPSL